VEKKIEEEEEEEGKKKRKKTKVWFLLLPCYFHVLYIHGGGYKIKNYIFIIFFIFLLIFLYCFVVHCAWKKEKKLLKTLLPAFKTKVKQQTKHIYHG
jgi:hypothetical protein